MGCILIIDDEEYIRDIIKANLEIYGHSILEAADGLEGVEKASRIPPDLIIMDIGMPVLDGLQACQVLKANRRTGVIPVLGFSGTADHRQIDRAMALGFDDFTAKPFREDELISKVNALMGRSSA